MGLISSSDLAASAIATLESKLFITVKFSYIQLEVLSPLVRTSE